MVVFLSIFFACVLGFIMIIVKAVKGGSESDYTPRPTSTYTQQTSNQNAQKVTVRYWNCKCGCMNTGFYCKNCGQRYPVECSFHYMSKEEFDKKQIEFMNKKLDSMKMPTNNSSAKMESQKPVVTPSVSVSDTADSMESASSLEVKTEDDIVPEVVVSDPAMDSVTESKKEEAEVIRDLEKTEKEEIEEIKETEEVMEPSMPEEKKEETTSYSFTSSSSYVSEYDSEGYDKDGYNFFGYNKEGFDREGYNRCGYDKDGYDKDGYDKRGYNREGYDQFGYDKEGYNKDGYDQFGLKKNE